MGRLILFIILFSSGSFCAVQAQDKALELLEGTWVSRSDSSVREIWDKSLEGWTGRSVRINTEGEEEVWEKLRVFYEGDSLIYEADVVENNGPVQFRLLRKGKKELLFTNPGHDFPRFIHYKWEDENNLTVEVYSKKGGKKLVFEYLKEE